MPPLRFWIAPALAGLEIVALEKANAITAGGISGIAIAFYRFTHLPVGASSMLLKVLIFAAVLIYGGRRLALWTIVAAALMSAWTYLFEVLGVQVHLPLVVAVVLIVAFSHVSSALLISGGYSSGGFSAIAQLLQKRLPVGVTYLICNVIGIVLITLAYGKLSGAASTIATVASAPITELWLRLFRRILPATGATVADRQAS